ncbi:hypothetical protein D3C81_856230 [compost metagenome]
MSTFVLRREYALQMPINYVEVNNDEMEYVDGGWSIYVLSDNIRGLMGSSGAFRAAMGGVAISYTWSYLTTVTMIGGKVAAGAAAAAATLTGPIGLAVGAVAALGASAAIWYLGNNRVFY